jgi:hypothetical protein
MYTELPTYKIVIVDRCSRNLEHQSHPPVAACMSRVESLRLLQRALPKPGFSCLNFSQDEISNFKDLRAYVVCMISSYRLLVLCQLNYCNFTKFLQFG